MLSLIESYFSILMLLGVSQAILSIYLILKERERPFSNNMLALLIFAWGFSCYWFFAFIAKSPFFSVKVTTFIGPMLALTLFPPVFLYAKYMFYEYEKFQKKDHLHFIPIYFYTAFTLYLYYKSEFSIDEMRASEYYQWRRLACGYIAALQGPFYFIKTNHLLKLRQRRLEEQYSDIESHKLEWFRKINLSFFLVFIIGGISTLVRSVYVNPYVLYMSYHAILAISLFYISIIIYKYPILFKKADKVSKVSIVIDYEEGITKPLKNQVPDEPQNSKDGWVMLKIEKIMREKKLYTNPNFSLNDLAEAISESRNTTSSALNNSLNKTFYNYINELRIEESKRLLSDKNMQHFSIEGVAIQSGFKTMSVFYRFFKDVEKVTPAVYRKRFLE